MVDGTENPVTEKRTVYFECNSGCTLIESMLLLVVVSVILLVAQRPLLEFHRVSISRAVKSSVAGRLSKFLEFAQIWADLSWRCTDFLKWNCCGNFDTQTCLQNWPIPWRRFGVHSGKISYSYDPATKVLSRKSWNSVTKHWLNPYLQYNLN